MRLPLQIVFHDLKPSAAIEARIRAKAEKLDLYYDQIMRCRVVVEAPHRRHHKGKLYAVHINVTVPDGELVVNRNPAQHHAHEDVYVAMSHNLSGVLRRRHIGGVSQRYLSRPHFERLAVSTIWGIPPLIP